VRFIKARLASTLLLLAPGIVPAQTPAANPPTVGPLSDKSQPTALIVLNAQGARLAGQKVVLSGVSGRALAEIEVTDDISAFHLPGGSVAQVAAYTEHWHEFSILRKILLRMKSWENYIFLEGH
jgi:hypothetical protein